MYIFAAHWKTFGFSLLSLQWFIFTSETQFSSLAIPVWGQWSSTTPQELTSIYKDEQSWTIALHILTSVLHSKATWVLYNHKEQESFSCKVCLATVINIIKFTDLLNWLDWKHCKTIIAALAIGKKYITFLGQAGENWHEFKQHTSFLGL